MVTKEQIQEWKDKYTYVFRAVIAGKEYYFHTLTRDTYLDIHLKQAMDPQSFDNDVEVFKACVLGEYDEKELVSKGGIAAVIAEKIMIASGFEMTEIEEL